MRIVLFAILSLCDTQLFMNFFAVIAVMGSFVVSFSLFSRR